MSEYINLSISFFAVLISLASFVYSWRQYRDGVSVRGRDELIDALNSFSRFKIMHNLMVRERRRTGVELEGYEQELIATFEDMLASQEVLSEAIHVLLGRKNVKVNQDFLTSLRVAKQGSDSMSHWVDLLFDRFKRFNENRVFELKDKLDSLKADLDEVQAYLPKNKRGGE